MNYNCAGTLKVKTCCYVSILALFFQIFVTVSVAMATKQAPSTFQGSCLRAARQALTAAAWHVTKILLPHWLLATFPAFPLAEKLHLTARGDVQCFA